MKWLKKAFRHLFRRDISAGEMIDLGLKYGNFIPFGECVEKYIAFSTPIPFTEHHKQDFMRDCVCMHQLYFCFFRSKRTKLFAIRNGEKVSTRIGFFWAPLREYDYCAIYPNGRPTAYRHG